MQRCANPGWPAGLPGRTRPGAPRGARLLAAWGGYWALLWAALLLLGLAEVDVLVLKTAGLVGQMAKTIKVVKTGVLTKAVKLNGIGATAGAKAAIEAAGGSVA